MKLDGNTVNEAVRDELLDQFSDDAPRLTAAALFALAHQVGRIATVLEGLTPLIELGLAEARKEARG